MTAFSSLYNNAKQEGCSREGSLAAETRVSLPACVSTAGWFSGRWAACELCLGTGRSWAVLVNPASRCHRGMRSHLCRHAGMRASCPLWSAIGLLLWKLVKHMYAVSAFQTALTVSLRQSCWTLLKIWVAHKRYSSIPAKQTALLQAVPVERPGKAPWRMNAPFHFMRVL